jgi:hypothetical protein
VEVLFSSFMMGTGLFAYIIKMGEFPKMEEMNEKGIGSGT